MKKHRGDGPSAGDRIVLGIERADSMAQRVLAVWEKSPGKESWPTPVDQLLVAIWDGQLIAWPGGETEVFEIFRVDDGSIVGEEELDGRAAVRLGWCRLPVPGVDFPFAH